MKKVSNVDLEIIKEVANEIFATDYVTNGKSMLGFSKNDGYPYPICISVCVGNEEIAFSQVKKHDINLRAVVAKAYQERGYYVDFSFAGEGTIGTLYAKIYTY